MSYPGLIAETVKYKMRNGDDGEAYYARPTAPGKVPGVVLIHHMPGWDEWIMEATRKLAHHGFATVSPHLYFREGPGNPDDVGARVRGGRWRGRRSGGRRRQSVRGLAPVAA
jgi:carboxymethylenebutenolidase